MSRLGSDNQREHEHAERSPDSVATPIDVRVPEGGPGVRGASVDGALVVAAPGEEIQNAVLNRLHRLALAAGHPVLATIHDRRVGYSVPLRVDPDGSSHLAADPVPTGPAPTGPVPTGPVPTDPTPEEPEEAPVRQDRRTRILRSVAPVADSAPTFTLRALPEPAGGTPPGTVAPPTGVFGPPPRMDGAAATGAPEEAEPLPVPGPVAVTRPPADSTPAPTSAPVSTGAAPA
ncbi:tetratricopeptide repeat protein, partial [Streptomyces sp. ICN988]|nr:tetratricopeptide repeat protein [Streptomyces sp. ICN988]